MTLGLLSLLFECKFLMLLDFKNIGVLNFLIIFFDFGFLHIVEKVFVKLRLQHDHQSDADDLYFIESHKLHNH